MGKLVCDRLSLLVVVYLRDNLLQRQMGAGYEAVDIYLGKKVVVSEFTECQLIMYCQ